MLSNEAVSFKLTVFCYSIRLVDTVAKLMRHLALTGVAKLVGRLPAKQKVTSVIPGQGTCPGCMFSLDREPTRGS